MHSYFQLQLQQSFLRCVFPLCLMFRVCDLFDNVSESESFSLSSSHCMKPKHFSKKNFFQKIFKIPFLFVCFCCNLFESVVHCLTGSLTGLLLPVVLLLYDIWWCLKKSQPLFFSKRKLSRILSTGFATKVHVFSRSRVHCSLNLRGRC